MRTEFPLLGGRVRAPVACGALAPRRVWPYGGALRRRQWSAAARRAAVHRGYVSGAYAGRGGRGSLAAAAAADVMLRTGSSCGGLKLLAGWMDGGTAMAWRR